MIEFKEAYIKGIDCWNNHDFIEARKWLEISAKDLNYQKASLLKLMKIDLKEGKYAKVRRSLQKNNILEFKKIYGLLEKIEYNFAASMQYYNECLQDPNMQYSSLFSIARLYIQMGDYDIARKILETLQLNSKFYIVATIELIQLNVLEKDFNYAYKLLKSLEKYKNTQPLNLYYKSFNIILLYFFNNLNNNHKNWDPKKDYLACKLLDNSDKTLIKHLRLHFNQKERDTNGCFFEYLSLPNLLNTVRNKIELINPVHFKLNDIYKLKLSKPIGYKEDGITSDIEVITILGTKDIITMYPVSLSDEFDKEKMATSKELKIKRSSGGQK